MNTSPLRSFWHSPASLNRTALILAAGAIVAGGVFLAMWMANRPVFVVKRVIVDASRGALVHVSAPQVHAAIAETLNGTTLSADLSTVHQSVQAIPWVRSVTVRRIWPNRLLVRIEEHRAVATWSSGYLVNHVGEIFPGLAADHEDDCQLIPLRGPQGSERLVLDRARQLSQWIAPLHRPLQALTLSDQYAWTAELTGSITLELGRDSLATPLEERVRMFVKTQPWLERQITGGSGRPALVRADLRYATGYAFLPTATGTATHETGSGPSRPLCIGVHA